MSFGQRANAWPEIKRSPDLRTSPRDGGLAQIDVAVLAAANMYAPRRAGSYDN